MDFLCLVKYIYSPDFGTLDIVVLEEDPLHNITQHLVLVQWALII